MCRGPGVVHTGWVSPRPRRERHLPGAGLRCNGMEPLCRAAQRLGQPPLVAGAAGHSPRDMPNVQWRPDAGTLLQRVEELHAELHPLPPPARAHRMAPARRHLRACAGARERHPRGHRGPLLDVHSGHARRRPAVPRPLGLCAARPHQSVAPLQPDPHLHLPHRRLHGRLRLGLGWADHDARCESAEPGGGDASVRVRAYGRRHGGGVMP
mmetsp:Transcript_64704/g.134910  ORF Transcript_64704/g.134910 Transcript_64704/m.134910 type:complete len:210 (+) Transcript_64704:972-1601(+)